MESDRIFLVLALALRHGQLSPEGFLSLAEKAALGGDVRHLLLDRGLDEDDLKSLEAAADERIKGQATVRMPAPATEVMEPPPVPGASIISSRKPVPPAGSPAADGARFILGEELGRGGLGRVVEATDTQIGRTVALKILNPSASPEMIERFRWECRITGRLEHPNIVPVHDVGDLPGTRQAFLCMKRISGRNLRDVIRDGGCRLRRLVEAFRDVCRAVAYAHSRGVIHRDLKPANMMLGDYGEVLVVDWGIARVIGEDDRAARLTLEETQPGTRASRPPDLSVRTMVGEVLGTPAYMPPEQARGLPGKVDERSDIYSLGATLYEILTGQAPFDAPTPLETLQLVIHKDLVPPSKIRPCPPDLESICVRAMEKRPENRYGSVVELGEDLQAWLEGASNQERP